MDKKPCESSTLCSARSLGCLSVSVQNDVCVQGFRHNKAALSAERGKILCPVKMCTDSLKCVLAVRS